LFDNPPMVQRAEDPDEATVLHVPIHGLPEPAWSSIDRSWSLLRASRWQLATKRTIDIVGALLTLVLLSPLLLITALAVLATSRGGIFYTQVRVGRGGRPFTIIKFRTMHEAAHSLMGYYEGLNDLDGPIFKLRNDPRVTQVGRWLRRFSIDEIPQLVNVLRGDMSLVGPRPLVPEEYAHFSPYEVQRLLATPGLTGIWQVGGRCDVDFHSWIEMDLEYIRRWNLRLDLTVLAKTVPAVALGRGSY
jgi:lipopolysaccharide/colanic/teichoic acid biosynthesis glycosyltransferase